MKKTRRSTVVIASILVLASIMAASIFGQNSNSSAENSPYLPGQRPISGPVSNEMMTQIERLGLSTGEVRLSTENKDAWGNLQIVCQDDLYSYFFDANSMKLIAAYMHSEGLDAMAAQEEAPALSTDEYISLAKHYLQIAYPNFNEDTTQFFCEPDQSTYPKGYVIFKDKQGDTLVNTATMIFSAGGVPIYLGGTHNTLKDFQGENYLDAATIKEIVFQVVLEYKTEVDKTGLLIPDDPENQPGEDEGNETIEFPPFELYLDSMDDLSFVRLEKEMMNNEVVWKAEAQVNNSYGDIDPILNFIYWFAIDARTGTILETDTLSGNP